MGENRDKRTEERWERSLGLSWVGTSVTKERGLLLSHLLHVTHSGYWSTYVDEELVISSFYSFWDLPLSQKYMNTLDRVL